MQRVDSASPANTAHGIPESVETVYVLSRVTLGADIKITSVILDAMKKRFRDAAIVLVANRKSIDLYKADSRLHHIDADYPRSGPVRRRIEFAHELRRRLEGANPIVVDPDSRMTAARSDPGLRGSITTSHFSSRTANSAANLTDLDAALAGGDLRRIRRRRTSRPTVSPSREIPVARAASLSLGVGENDSKRIGGDFWKRS